MLEALVDMIVPILVPLVATIGAAVGAAVKTIKFVHEGERGIRLRFGKATRDKEGVPKVIEPGFVLLIPFAETLQRRHVRQQTIRLENQTVVTTEGLVFNLSAFLLFRVEDVYKAMFEINGLSSALTDFIQGHLKVVACAKDRSGILDAKAIAEEVRKLIEPKASEWGVTFLEFGVTDVFPSDESAQVLVMEARGKELKRLSTVLEVPMTPGLAMVLVGAPLVASSASGEAVIDHKSPPSKDES
jgi:regulator of protease activity HflC (stomatin/prohibitin superfamily)